MLFYFVTAFIISIFFVFPGSKWTVAVMLFVAFIPQGALLGEEDQLIGFIDHRSVVSLFVIATAYINKSILLLKLRFDKLKVAVFILVIVLMVFLPRYIEIKNAILFGDFDLLIQIKRLTRDSIFAFAVYLVLKRMYDYRTLQGIEIGLWFGILLAVSSMLFSNFFLDLGFNLHTGSKVNEDGEFLRLTGFLGKDPNEASRIFNLVFAYILAKSEAQKRKKNIVNLFMSGILIIGLFIFASKTGLTVALILILTYIFRISKNIKLALGQGLIFVIMSFVLYNYFGDYMEKRIEEQISGEFDTFEARQDYWQLYLKDIIDNPNYLIIGNLGHPTYSRDVHNTYIWYLFYTGLISFSLILFLFWRIFKLRNRYRNNYLYFTPLYALIALMISWITGAGQLNYWFVFIVAASTGIPEYYYKISTTHQVYQDSTY